MRLNQFLFFPGITIATMSHTRPVTEAPNIAEGISTFCTIPSSSSSLDVICNVVAFVVNRRTVDQQCNVVDDIIDFIRCDCSCNLVMSDTR